MEDRNIRFVAEVEKYPELYDYTKPSYSRKNIVEKAWAEVGKKFNLTGNESKEKWRNLRNSFVKNLKPPASGSSARKKVYYLSDAMQFALPFVKVSGKPSGSLPQVPSFALTAPEPSSLEGSFCEEHEAPISTAQRFSQHSVPTPLQYSVPSTSLTPPSPTPPSPTPTLCPLTSSSASLTPIYEERNEQGRFSVKRKRGNISSMDTEKNIADYFLAKKKYVEAKQQGVSGQSDALKMFVLSLLPDLESLTPAQIRIFKRRTLDLIEELLDGDSTNYMTPSLMTTASQSSSPIVVSLVQSPSAVELPLHEVQEQSPATQIGDSENVGGIYDAV